MRNNIMNYVEIANKAVIESDAKWIAKNGEGDFGTCGSAVVLIYTGRKKKVKDELIQSGIIDPNNTWDHYGNKHFVANFEKSFVGGQNIDYYESQARAVVSALSSIIPEGVDVDYHSWVD